mmetsp:Transcript_35575/g.58951  ORF Transcript_35575/g.58951 Transcript_35575/m.58951 type:complete len:135 (-) Transcript_35575:512-916(-)
MISPRPCARNNELLGAVASSSTAEQAAAALQQSSLQSGAAEYVPVKDTVGRGPAQRTHMVRSRIAHIHGVAQGVATAAAKNRASAVASAGKCATKVTSSGTPAVHEYVTMALTPLNSPQVQDGREVRLAHQFTG